MSGIVSIGKESVDRFFAGHSSVNVTPQLLHEVGCPVRKHVVVRADSGNGSEEIAIGPVGHAAQGFVLNAGETSPPIYVENTDMIEVVATGAADYSWIAT